MACLGKRFWSTESPTTSRVKSSEDSFSAITPLQKSQQIAPSCGSYAYVDLPLDYLVVEFLKTLLNLGNVDILAPCLLAFPGRLLVLLGSIGVAREGL